MICVCVCVKRREVSMGLMTRIKSGGAVELIGVWLFTLCSETVYC